MKVKTTRKLMLVATVALLSGSMVVYAAATLFTQTIPGQTFAVVSLNVGSCGSALSLDAALSQVPSISGNSAHLGFDCNGSPAFTTNGTVSESATATPAFTLPNSNWGLWVWPVGTDACNGTPAPAYPLTSGTPVALEGGTSYVYCLMTSSAASFSSFSITWSQ